MNYTLINKIKNYSSRTFKGNVQVYATDSPWINIPINILISSEHLLDNDFFNI